MYLYCSRKQHWFYGWMDELIKYVRTHVLTCNRCVTYKYVCMYMCTKDIDCLLLSWCFLFVLQNKSCTCVPVKWLTGKCMICFNYFMYVSMYVCMVHICLQALMETCYKQRCNLVKALTAHIQVYKYVQVWTNHVKQ